MLESKRNLQAAMSRREKNAVTAGQDCIVRRLCGQCLSLDGLGPRCIQKWLRTFQKENGMRDYGGRIQAAGRKEGKVETNGSEN